MVARKRGRPRGAKDRHGKAHRVKLGAGSRWLVESIAENLGKIMREQDVSVTELAAACDVNPTAVFVWLRPRPNARNLMSVQRLAQLAMALDVQVIDLVGDP